jgi:hypothetical protein
VKKILPIISISFLCLAFSFSDTSGLKILILNRLNEYVTEKYPEKIYIQTDKPYYTAGENIWFDAYLVNGVTHRMSNKSNVIYVELINKNDSIISERMLYTKSVSVKGDFQLPADLKEGNYLLRAYTNYMRNQSRSYFFRKEIPIFALYKDKSYEIDKAKSKTQEKLGAPDIGFYPEGGYLVNGIKNKVAVKIKGADLLTKPVFGTIEDMKGNKITEFKTVEFGLGTFYLNPEPGKKYHAVVPSENEDILYPLPAPLSEGYVMNTSITDKEVVINITTNKADGLKNTLLIGQQRGLAAFDYSQDKNTKTMRVKIPKTNLIEGVLDIVLFNKSEKPVAERLAYIKKEENISVSVKKTNGTTTGIRDRVNMEIEVKDKSGRLVPSTLSLSITDAELIKPNPNAGNIRTYLLLNSDIRGKIKSPNYFFTAGDTFKKDKLLDLTMLTQGWSRFRWQELIQKSSFQKYKPEDGIYISGHTIDSKTPFRSKFCETKITFRKKGFVQETQNTDENGYFSYGPYTFKDDIGVLLQAGEGLSSEKPNFSDTNIKLSPPEQKPTIIPDRKITPFDQMFQKPKEMETYKQQTKKNIVTNFEFDKERELLDEVNIKTKRITKEEIDNIKRNKRTHNAFEPSYRILVDDMGMHGSGNFMELIANIPGIRIGNDPDAYDDTQHLAITLRGLKPEYWLDGIKVNLSIMMSVPQTNIDFIDVRNVGHASANFAFAAGGVIAIYSKQGSRAVDVSKITNRRAGSISFKLDGFYNSREFYSPDYSFEDRNSTRADNRTTLYWQPNIEVKENRNAHISFYTSDDKGRFQIEIEGITDNGVPVHKTAFLEVD